MQITPTADAGSRLVYSTTTPTSPSVGSGTPPPPAVSAPAAPPASASVPRGPITSATRGAAAAVANGTLDDYYRLADGKTGADLLFTLHTITRTGHVDRGYSQARQELFSEVSDTDGDNMVPDLFTGELRGPITGKDSGYDRGLNTEHTWPQSKGATGIAQSDLHHLFPADIKTNERRGSYPYGEVSKVTWATSYGPAQAKLGVDLLGKTVFEPQDSVKGDIARGLLYFYTRYSFSKTARFTTENFEHELPTLLKWAKQDPVDDVERARNSAIQAVQGNRNPYVDHPEYIDLVDFAHMSLRGRPR